MVQITINGKQIEVPEGTTVLRAAEMAGIQIPKLCDHKELTPYGGCRLCIVEVQGVRELISPRVPEATPQVPGPSGCRDAGRSIRLGEPGRRRAVDRRGTATHRGGLPAVVGR